MSKICFTIASLSSLSRVSFVSSLSSCVSSLSSPAFSRRCPAFSCRYSPAFPHHSSLPLAIDSRTLSTTQLVRTRTPSFSTLTLGQPPRETSRSAVRRVKPRQVHGSCLSTIILMAPCAFPRAPVAPAYCLEPRQIIGRYCGKCS